MNKLVLIAFSAGMLAPLFSDANAKDQICDTIKNCIKSHDCSTVHRLLAEHPSYANHPNELGISPLYYASSFGNPHIAENLLNAKANPNGNGDIRPLDAANGIHVTELLIAKGADVSKGHPLSGPAARGDLCSVKLLLAKGAKPNIFHAGWTPLHEAAYHGHRLIVKELLAHGADPQLKVRSNTFLGKTARELAIMQGHTNISALLP